LEESEKVEGKNSVLEALRGKRRIEKILVASEARKFGALKTIVDLARKKGIPVREVSRREISRIAPSEHNQGVVAFVSPYHYVMLEDLTQSRIEEKPYLFLTLDGVEDPRNFGALLRVAEASGVDGVIIGKRRSTGVTATVVRTSAGAAEHVKIARVANVSNSLLKLKEEGIWIVGVEVGGSIPYYQVDYTKDTCVVLGGEGKGLRRLTAQQCDVVVRIPMLGNVESLNVATAGAVVLFEAARQRASSTKPA